MADTGWDFASQLSIGDSAQDYTGGVGTAGAGGWSGWAPIAGGALSALGGVAQGIFGNWEANKQMAFQERMANTAYQRQVADMRAAGLNPILAAMKGGGAPSPMGSSAAMGDVSGAGAGVTNSARMRALELPALKSQLALNSANEFSARQAGDAKGSETALNEAQRSQVLQLTNPMVDVQRANAQLMRSSAARQDAEADLIRANTSERRFKGRLWDIGNEFLDIGESAGLNPGKLKLQGVGDVFGNGQGNVYGGAHSAKSGRW